MKKITVTIKGGKTQVSTEGFSGSACQDATRNLEAALGKTTSEDLTQEYFNENTQTQDQ